MYEESIQEEFTHQADSFAGSPAMNAAEILGALVELTPEDGEEVAPGRHLTRGH